MCGLSWIPSKSTIRIEIHLPYPTACTRMTNVAGASADARARTTIHESLKCYTILISAHTSHFRISFHFHYTSSLLFANVFFCFTFYDVPVPLPCRITIEFFKNSFFFLCFFSLKLTLWTHTHRQRLEEKLDFVFVCINFCEMKKKYCFLRFCIVRARGTNEKGTGSQRTRWTDRWWIELTRIQRRFRAIE